MIKIKQKANTPRNAIWVIEVRARATLLSDWSKYVKVSDNGFSAFWKQTNLDLAPFGNKQNI